MSHLFIFIPSVFLLLNLQLLFEVKGIMRATWFIRGITKSVCVHLYEKNENKNYGSIISYGEMRYLRTEFF